MIRRLLINKLFLTIFILSFTLVTLFFLFGLANKAGSAESCSEGFAPCSSVPPGGTPDCCPISTPEPGGGCPAEYTPCSSTAPGAPPADCCPIFTPTPGESCPVGYEPCGSVVPGAPPDDCCPSSSATPGGGGGGTSGGGGGTSGGGLGTININFPEIGTIVSNLYIIALFAAAVFFLIQFAIGGISWIGAGGDPKSLEAARSRLTNAVIGLVIVLAAFAVSVTITTLLGIPIFKVGGVTILH